MRRVRALFGPSADGSSSTLSWNVNLASSSVNTSSRAAGTGFKPTAAGGASLGSTGGGSAVFQQQQSPKGLWAGSWTTPFDGGGRTRVGGVSQAIFNFRLYQAVVNTYESDGFFLRSTQDGVDWELWQRTPGRGTGEMAMVAFVTGSKYILVQAAVIDGAIYVRYSSDAINWHEWKYIQNGKTRGSLAMFAYRQRLFLVHVNSYKKVSLSTSTDAENWTPWKSISSPFPQIEEAQCLLSMTEFSGRLFVCMVGSDNRIHYSYSNDGDVFAAWKTDTQGKTKLKVESVGFGSRLYQAIVGLDGKVYERSSNDLIQWTEWTQTNIKTSSAVSMVVFDNKLIQAFHGMDNDVYVRYSVDGHNWTKWSSTGQKRKTDRNISQIVFKGVLFQSIISLDDFILTRPIESTPSHLTRFKFDDTMMGSLARDERYFFRLLEDKVSARLSSIGNEASDLSFALAKNDSLTRLDLSGSNVGNDGVSIIADSLRNHPALKSLILNDVQLIGGMAEFDSLIRYNSVLQELFLGRNKLGDDGARNICAAVSASGSLRLLELSENGITSVGAQVLAECLVSNTGLRSLLLGHNVIASQGAMAIAKALDTNRTLTRLDIHANKISSEAARLLGKMFSQNKNLKRVNLGSQNFQRIEAIKPISDALVFNVSLTELDLSASGITAEGAATLSKFIGQAKVLTYLNLENNMIEDEGAIAISGSLWSSPVQTLLLSNNDIGRVGATAIAKALQSKCNVSVLSLDNNYISQAARELAAMLQATQSLTHLSANGCRFGDSAIEEISRALHSNTTLKSLFLDNNSFSAFGVKTLAKMADHNASLLHLSLWRNPVGVQNAQELAMVVARNGIMQSLSVEFTCPSTSGRFEEILKLGSMLRDNPALIDIGLKGDLGEDGARALAETILENNATIKSLYLVDGFIGNQGIKHICDAVASCSSLEYLNLQGNNIDATGASIIADMLSSNRSIKVLDLSVNTIGYDGLNAISVAVRKNPCLNRIIIDSSYAEQTDLAVAPEFMLIDV